MAKRGSTRMAKAQQSAPAHPAEQRHQAAPSAEVQARRRYEASLMFRDAWDTIHGGEINFERVHSRKRLGMPPPPPYIRATNMLRQAKQAFGYPVIESPATKLVLDAFSKAGITFDPNHEIDAQWRLILDARFESYDASVTMPVPPRSRIQDKNSRLATEHLLSKLREVRSAVLLCEQEAERPVSTVKQNVALRVREELFQLQIVWKPEPVAGHDHFQWIASFVSMIDDLEGSAVHALKVGIHAPHGKSKLLVAYTVFVRGLYELWMVKKSDIGVYKSGGRYTGPFVELVERCEQLLSPDLKPPSVDARGKRVARAIGVLKSRKGS
jgi:hypothetical protein